MMKIPIYGNKKLIAGFEFGINISETLKENKVEMTKEMVLRAEDILVKELSTKSHRRFVLDSIPNILAVIEPK